MAGGAPGRQRPNVRPVPPVSGRKNDMTDTITKRSLILSAGWRPGLAVDRHGPLHRLIGSASGNRPRLPALAAMHKQGGKSSLARRATKAALDVEAAAWRRSIPGMHRRSVSMMPHPGSRRKSGRTRALHGPQSRVSLRLWFAS